MNMPLVPNAARIVPLVSNFHWVLVILAQCSVYQLVTDKYYPGGGKQLDGNTQM